MDIMNIIEAVREKIDKASAIQCLMRILPSGGAWVEKNIFSNQYSLFHEKVIQYEMSAEVFVHKETITFQKLDVLLVCIIVIILMTLS